MKNRTALIVFVVLVLAIAAALPIIKSKIKSDRIPASVEEDEISLLEEMQPPHSREFLQANLKGRNSSVLCRTCHPFYPHEQKWSLAASHGRVFMGFIPWPDRDQTDQRDTCLKCHGENRRLKTEFPDHFVSCTTCHKSYPHPEGYLMQHAEFAGIAYTYEGKCTICHSDLREDLPTTGRACDYPCHRTATNKGLFPLADWDDPPQPDDD
ncbi:hypothetical protein ACFLRA_01200 [Bdellovibrionota bacterium]